MTEANRTEDLGAGSIYPLMERTETDPNVNGLVIHTNHYSGGMTRREYVAVAALNGCLAANCFKNPEQNAEYAVRCADALLKELAK
jgi:hypothetical protein